MVDTVGHSWDTSRVDHRTLNEFRFLSGLINREQLVMEERRRLSEDPNSLFAPSPPKTGRKVPVTSTLMGTEDPGVEPEEGLGDETGNTPELVIKSKPQDAQPADLQRTLSDPRYRREKEIQGGSTLKRVVGPGDTNR